MLGEATTLRVFEAVIEVGDLVAVLDTTPPTVKPVHPRGPSRRADDEHAR